MMFLKKNQMPINRCASGCCITSLSMLQKLNYGRFIDIAHCGDKSKENDNGNDYSQTGLQPFDVSLLYIPYTAV